MTEPANETETGSDEFVLYDLRVVVESVGPRCTCNMRAGDSFEMQNGKLALPEGQTFCVYALQSVIPLLPAKQRMLHPADWMSTDVHATCPDPACQLIMRIERVRPRRLRHLDTSVVPLPASQDEDGKQESN